MIDDDVFSQDEAMFFQSGGQEVGNLLKPEEPAKEPATTDANPVDPAAKEPAKEPATGEEEEPGAIDIGQQQTVRDAKTGRYVPVGVLRSTREELKTSKAEREALREQNAKLMGVFERIAASPAFTPQPKAPEPPAEEKPIDPGDDLIGSIRQLGERLAKADEARQKAETTTKEHLAQVEINQVITNQIATERSKDPADFDAAMQHLATARAAQLGLMWQYRGQDGKPDPAKIQAQLRADINGIATDALRGKSSAGAALYEFAKAFGYQKKAGTVDPAKAATDAAAAARAATSDKTPAQEALDAIGAGSDASRTLSHSGAGGASPNGLTVDEFLAMDDDTLHARLAANPKLQDDIDRLLGKRV